MVMGSLLLLGLFVFPLWKIMLGAPQYPEPLGMNIYITGIEGVNEFDIQNIDGLNHYIGMKTIPKNDEMWEFTVFPIVTIAMVSLGVIAGVLVFLQKIKPVWLLFWFLLMSVLGVLGMYDFNAWLTDYGSNLDPNAIMKMTNPDGSPMTYKPPLIGNKKMLNFDVSSWPNTGAWMMFFGMMLTLIAYLLGRTNYPTTTNDDE